MPEYSISSKIVLKYRWCCRLIWDVNHLKPELSAKGIFSILSNLTSRQRNWETLSVYPSIFKRLNCQNTNFAKCENGFFWYNCKHLVCLSFSGEKLNLRGFILGLIASPCYLTCLTWLIHTSILPSKWNLHIKLQFLA